MYHDLTKGGIAKSLLLFSLPMTAGNLLQQLYNIADTLIVGRALGRDALAAVGSAYTLMTFLTSVFIGLAMGSGALFSIYIGKDDREKLKDSVWQSFVLIFAVTAAINTAVYIFIDPILRFLKVPDELYSDMREYLVIIFAGIAVTFLYNFLACLIRAAGDSVSPLIFLGVSAVINIGLDLLFVLVFDYGIAGAAAATVISQYISGIGMLIFTLAKRPELIPERKHIRLDRKTLGEICDLSILTSAQQSAMNFGILLVQRLVDSFGPVVMAAFAASVKIDSFAYLPVQDFGNAFSTFAAQNYGAGKKERIRQGIRQSVISVILFCIVISCGVFVLAQPLMQLFVSETSREIIAVGVQYLRIEGACYVGIGILFMLYGYYRAVNRPNMSVVLTVISLGTRVLLSYTLSKISWLGVTGIWVSIPIGWFLADAVGILVYLRSRRLDEKG